MPAPSAPSASPPTHSEQQQPLNTEAARWPNPPALPSVSDITITPSPASAPQPPLSATSAPATPATHAIDATRLSCDFDDPLTRIGVGTYGSVHVATYFGALVAVKRVHIPDASPLPAADPVVRARHDAALRRFACEISRYEAVSHPGIVRFLGVTIPRDAAAALLVTDLMRGGSLAGALEELRRWQVPLQSPSFVRIALQACGGIRALHAAGCTWGDAKPSNVLLSANVGTDGVFPKCAEARIADFGLSRSVANTLLADTTIAGTGQPPGTYNYMAPEMFTGTEAETAAAAKSADIYALGLIMYEMITLRTPWKRRQMHDVYSEVTRGTRPPWPAIDDVDYWGGVPEDLRELVESCWSQKPLARPSAEDVFTALERFSVSLAKQDTSSQRHVSGISSPSVVHAAITQCAAVNGNSIARPPSKQSNVSTAVPIGDATADLHSSGFNSTRDSVKCDGVSDEDHGMYEGLTGLKSMNDGARVSPVTSPEPRSLNNPSEPMSVGAYAVRDNTQTRVSMVSASTLGTNAAARKHLGRSGGPTTDTESAPGTVQNSTGMSTAANIDGTTASLTRSAVHPESPQEVTGDTRPWQDATASHNLTFRDAQHSQTGHDVSHYLNVGETSHATISSPRPSAGHSESFSKHSRSEHKEVASPHTDMTSTFLGSDTIDANTVDLSASYATSASFRRKRPKRRQNTIEQATSAALRSSKMSPKQRKEAADRKASEEAEKQAVAAVEAFQSAGDYSSILEVMKQHRSSRAVASLGTAALEPFCKDAETYYDVCEDGGVEELMSGTVRFGETDVRLCTNFCNIMTALSEHYDDKVGHLVRASGVPMTVVDVMSTHKTSAPVQISGCNCLGAIAGASELSRSAVATLGGPGAVYNAITKNNVSFKDVNLARAVLRAIRQIAQDNERAADFLVQASALDAVSRSVHVFTDDGLEEDTLSALGAFAFYNDGRRKIILSCGLNALTEIMLRNDDSEFLVNCCTFIRSIARWRDVECEDAMLRSCIAERITTLMEKSNSMPGEQGARLGWYASQACTFLASFGPRSRKRLRLVGAIEKAVSILTGRRENARVVRSATDALAELIKGDPEAKLEAKRCGALEALNVALTIHGNIRVKNAVQWTIDCLSSERGCNRGPAHGSQAHEDVISKNTKGEMEKMNPGGKRRLGFMFRKKR